MERRLLVVGARESSLGGAVFDEAAQLEHFAHVTSADADPAAAVAYLLDVTSRKSVCRVLEEVRPTDIVCTVGVNLPDGEPGTFIKNMERQMLVNAFGPLMLLAEAMDLWVNRSPLARFSFCAVSSNSARIARSESAGYCASKAALSQGLRCMARRYAPLHYVRIWGYEPGWINGTPMSDDVRMRLKPQQSPHRIPGGESVSRDLLAARIAQDVAVWDMSLNGCMVRLDGGEQ